MQKYSPECGVAAALYAAFRAKKASELAVGVGRDVDSMLIDERGLHPVEQEVLDKLEKAFERDVVASRELSAHDDVKDAVAAWLRTDA